MQCKYVCFIRAGTNGSIIKLIPPVLFETSFGCLPTNLANEFTENLMLLIATSSTIAREN